MKKCKYKNQNGAISAFVMVAMLFFLTTIIGVYMVVSKRAQTQIKSIDILEGQYYTENEEKDIYKTKVASEGDIIPVYTKEQLLCIGQTGKAVEIEGKVYDFSEINLTKYELKNDIVINLPDDDITEIKDYSELETNYKVYYYYNNDYYVYSEENPINIETYGYKFKFANLSEKLGYVTDGLILHYDGIRNTAIGHDTTIATWKDLSGNGNDGELNGCTWNADSLSFDGEDDYLGDITISNADGITFQVVMKNVVTTQYRNIYDRYSAQVPMLWLNPSSRFEFSIDYTLDQDYNDKKISVTNAMTKDTSNMFVNNQKVIDNFSHNKEINGTYQLFNRNKAQTYKGEIYSLRIYKKSLTDEEIRKKL